MKGVGILVVMEVVELTTIARGVWEVRGVEVVVEMEGAEGVDMQIVRSSQQLLHGRATRTNSLGAVMVAEV
jgi:hypothetical protein